MRSRQRIRIAFCTIVAIAILVPNTNVSAQDSTDTVWLEPPKADSAKDSWYPGSITQIEGRIQSFDHQAIKIIVTNEPSETAFAAYRVLWIELGRLTESENTLNTLMAEQKRPQSLDLLASILRDKELQTWRKQIAYVKFSNLFFQTSDHRTAMTMTREIGGPLPPLCLAWLPIAWTREHQVPTENEYRGWDPPEQSLQSQLVDLSWKLQWIGRETAVAAIDKIIADPSRPYIRQLAKALRWRLATPQQVIENAGTWEAEIDAMPMVLQVGPTLTLIEKLEAAGLAGEAERLKLSLKLTPPFPHPDLPRQ